MAVTRPTRAPMFDEFVLDAAEGCLWRAGRRLALTPKDFAVLQHLVAHAGRLVPAAELLTAVWRNTAVQRGVLKVAVRRLRRTLGDDATHPRYIENVHGRGYRFILPTEDADPAAPEGAGPLGLVVGRDQQLGWLVRRLDAALGGRRQLVLVSGAPGIGKTTLLETFAASFRQAVPDGRLAWGRCVEQRGPGEPYMPVLEALGRLCRARDRDQVVEALARRAPTWLLQLPGVLPPRRLETLRRRAAGATQARMLRELAEALDALAAEVPLVLYLEDLHWSDPSTLELLAALARRDETAHLLVLGTHRPLDRSHPLAELLRELRVHDACTVLEVAPLDERAVGDYLARRFGAIATGARVGAAVHARTAGNPLYLVHLVDALIRRGWLSRDAGQWRFGEIDRIAEVVPETLGAVIAQQIEGLAAAEQRVLDAASLTRTEFSAAAIAAALDETVEEADHQCAELARRRQLLRARGVAEWPDGTVAGAYDFAHPLYRDVLRARVPPAVATALHARLAARLEAAFGPQTAAMAVDLAEHCEGARKFVRATAYRRAAAATAVERAAYREAGEHLARALALWRRVPSAPEHRDVELRLQIGHANLLQRQQGPRAPDVETAYRRARLLWRRAPSSRGSFRVPLGLFDHHMARAELAAMRPLARQLWIVSRRSRRWDHRLVAHNALARVAFWTGELRTARMHYRQALAVARAPGAPGARAAFDVDAATVSANLGLVLWALADLDEASRVEREALALVRTRRNARTLGWVLGAACFRAGLAHDARDLDRLAREMLDAARRFELEIWAAPAERFRRWALVLDGQLDEAIAELRPEIAAALSGNLWQPLVWNALAEGCARAGRVTEAWAALDAAAAALRQSGAEVALPEWYRCRAIVWRASRGAGATAQAARSLRCALSVARRQGATSFEVRAARDLIDLHDTPERRCLLAAALRRVPAHARGGEVDAARALLGGSRRRSLSGRPSTDEHAPPGCGRPSARSS